VQRLARGGDKCAGVVPMDLLAARRQSRWGAESAVCNGYQRPGRGRRAAEAEAAVWPVS